MQSPNYFDIFKGANKQWYWNLHNGGNHAIIATGGEGFVSFDNALRAAKNFRDDAEHAYMPTREEAASMATSDIIDDIDEEEPDRTDQGQDEGADVDPPEQNVRDADNG